jgi:hypothetical protein
MERIMPRLVTLALFSAAVLTPLTAHAIPIDITFMGTVQSQIASGFSVNSPISGEFAYDTATGKYTVFTIGGRSVAPGYASSADVTPDMFSAIYQAQLSPVQQGGTLNSTFTLDLEALVKWPSNDAIALLTTPGVLAANLDKSLSSFGFFTANADGTNVHSLTASLSSIQAVPEPASLALCLTGLLALALVARARRANR